MNFLTQFAIAALLLLTHFNPAYAGTADDLYARSRKVPAESLTHFLDFSKNQIAKIFIHQGSAVFFDGDQGENYWMRQKDSALLFVLIRFKDGTRSMVLLDHTPTEVCENLYTLTTPLRIEEDGKSKVFAELKSLQPLKILIGERTVKVHQLSLLEPKTVYSVSN